MISDLGNGTLKLREPISDLGNDTLKLREPTSKFVNLILSIDNCIEKEQLEQDLFQI